MSSSATKPSIITYIPPSNPSAYQRIRVYLSTISFRSHLIISIVLRLALIAYGQVQDSRSEVPYTDIDYKVVTDGARHVLRGHSPFERHTYRYTPLLAYLQIPNVMVHPAIGKIVYSTFDVFVAMLIYALVYGELQSQCQKAIQTLLSKIGKKWPTSSHGNSDLTDERNRPESIARASACFWLYNPLTAVISTRGNGDSFSSFFVILTLYLLLRAEHKQNSLRCIFIAGLAHGFAIHLRLYPLLFSLAYYLSLSDRSIQSVRDFLKQLFFPSRQQLVLVAGTILSLASVTGAFYRLYGWQYIYEAYLYHFVRQDVRHNFSLYFLMQYLGCNAGDYLSTIEKTLIIAPQLLLLVYLSFSFGQFRQTLPFCVFSLAFVMVTFNSVVTSQYFVWYLSLLPLCINNLQTLTAWKSAKYFALWLLAQGLWLLPAYLLEFKTLNTFYWIGLQGAVFFLTNNWLLVRLIQHYSFTSFKVNLKKFL